MSRAAGMGCVNKPWMLRAYGLFETRLYRFRRVLFTLFLTSTDCATGFWRGA
jgi:hypothetical protein